MNVAVLGCGPSGLMAAHAARELGLEVHIYSLKKKSPIMGGQYLKIPIPGITGVEDSVFHCKMGDPEGYARKVYRDKTIPCFNFMGGEHPAWSMTEAYEHLWGVWQGLIKDQEIGPDDIQHLCESHDLVFNTLPRDKMCYKGHMFRVQRMVSLQGVSMIARPIENMIIYSGRERDSWYRTSNLFGHSTTEWSCAHVEEGEEGPWVPVVNLFGVQPEDMLSGVKPLETDCDCHDDWPNMHRLGRFGQWGHGILVSHAYEQANLILQENKQWLG